METCCTLAYAQMARSADPETRSQVLEILDSAQSLGLKVLRMWAFGEGPLQYNSLQRYPGANWAVDGFFEEAALNAWPLACAACFLCQSGIGLRVSCVS